MNVPAIYPATAILLALAWVFARLMQRRQNVAVLWLLCLLLVSLTVLVVLLSVSLRANLPHPAPPSR